MLYIITFFILLEYKKVKRFTMSYIWQGQVNMSEWLRKMESRCLVPKGINVKFPTKIGNGKNGASSIDMNARKTSTFSKLTNQKAFNWFNSPIVTLSTKFSIQILLCLFWKRLLDKSTLKNLITSFIQNFILSIKFKLKELYILEC